MKPIVERAQPSTSTYRASGLVQRPIAARRAIPKRIFTAFAIATSLVAEANAHRRWNL